jgi:hypothetical protein
VIGEPIVVSATTDDVVEHGRRELERALERLEARARALLSVEP